MLALLRTPLRPAFALHARTLATVVQHIDPIFSKALPFKKDPIPCDFKADKAATLHLKSGESFSGYAFGAPVSRYGEGVFSTAITSYTESMTDPSYRGQLLVFSTPLIGNYGVPSNSPDVNGLPVLESHGIQVAGIVVGDLALKHSSYLAVESLHQWCLRHGVPGITGVDTRAITTLLRNNGSTLSKLAVGTGHEVTPKDAEYWDPSKDNLVAQVSTPETYTINPTGDVKIAVLDFGAKANILRSLVKRGAAVTVFPWNFDFNTVRHEFDGLFLTNGPGDPKHCMEAAYHVRKTIDEWDKPVFGICMGHQIIGLAAGLDAYRMRFGNRDRKSVV